MTVQRRFRTYLSPREREILLLLADGLTNDEIAGRLQLSVETVKSHVRNLLARLDAKSRTHAVSIGFRQGLIPVDPESLPPAA